jgi:hypothetical protein
MMADAELRLSSLDDFTALAIEQQSLFPVRRARIRSMHTHII